MAAGAAAAGDASSMMDPEQYGIKEFEKYEMVKFLGEGQFAEVVQYREISTKKMVAIKKIKRGKASDGVALAAIGEIQALQELNHPNVIKLLNVFSYKDKIHCVLEVGITDLETIIKNPSVPLGPADIKMFMKMMLQGLAHVHETWMLHRDLKPGNLLLGEDNQLKLVDFGLARTFGSPGHQMFHQVVTLWYRAPELLFGAREYGVGIDMWSVGCIFVEMLNRDPFLPGRSELDQLARIFRALGTPAASEWPDVAALPSYMEFKGCTAVPWEELIPSATPDAIDLCRRFFIWDGAKRITAQQALEHPYFKSAPAPTAPERLPRPAAGTTMISAMAHGRQ